MQPNGVLYRFQKLIRIVADTVLENDLDVSHVGDFGRGITLDDNQIGLFAVCD